MVGESIRQRAQELSQFLLGRGRRTVGRVPKKGNGLFLRSEFTLVTHQSFLVDVAQAKIQIRKAPLLSALNPFPDQQIVRPRRKVIMEGRIELVVERVFPIQEEITCHNLILVNRQKQKSVIRIHELPPDILKETIRLREKTVFILPHFQVHLKKETQFLL